MFFAIALLSTTLPAAERPNILFIFSDDHSLQTIGAYEESLPMPLIVRWPGVVKPGTRISRLVQNIDYAPTFAEAAGGKTPSSLHGRSLVPLLRGENPADWRKSIYYHYYDPGHAVNPHYGVRTDDHALAFFQAPGMGTV